MKSRRGNGFMNFVSFLFSKHNQHKCFYLVMLVVFIMPAYCQENRPKADTLRFCRFFDYQENFIDGEWMPGQPDPQNEKLIKDIWQGLGGKRERIYVATDDQAGAGASTSYKSRPYVVYSALELARFEVRFGAKYHHIMNSIFLHELGHIYYWDPVGGKKPRKSFERDADDYCGFHMWSHFNAAKEDIKIVYEELCPEDSTEHYRGRQGRIEDAEGGWLRAHLSISRVSNLFALENSHSLSAKLANASFKAFASAEVMSLEANDSSIKKVVDMDIYKFNPAFKIIEHNDGRTFAALLNENDDSYEIVGRVVPSDDPNYKFRIVDKYYYSWYISDFNLHNGHLIYSSFNSSDETKYLIGEVKTAIDLKEK